MITNIEEELLEETTRLASKSPHASNKESLRTLMDTLKELVLDTPDVNHAKVERLKKEIAAGSYQISSKRIAMQLLHDMNI